MNRLNKVVLVHYCEDVQLQVSMCHFNFVIAVRLFITHFARVIGHMLVLKAYFWLFTLSKGIGLVHA